MKAGIELDDTIESYLKGSLSEVEKKEFEEIIASNLALKERVLEHMELISTFAVYARRKNIAQKFSEIHEDLFPIKEEKELTPLKIRKLQNPYKTFAIAASIALLLLSGTITAFYFRYVHSSGRAEFRELRRDVERIRNSQSAIINDINSENKSKNIIPANFMGTGFAISPNGYLLTSTHVIKDADSVYIEGTKGNFKAKVVFIDNRYDFAILKVEDSTFKGFGSLPYTFKKNESELGEKIYTLGFPREEIVFGEGSVSSVTGYLGDSSSYQVSIPVNPGNSGGPVLDERGNLIGLISGKQSTSDGAAFAIKSSLLMKSISNIPGDSLKDPIYLPKINMMSSQDRVKQLRKLKDYIFIVKVYN